MYKKSLENIHKELTHRMEKPFINSGFIEYGMKKYLLEVELKRFSCSLKLFKVNNSGLKGELIKDENLIDQITRYNREKIRDLFKVK